MNKKITEIDFINDSDIKSIVIKIDNSWFELGFMNNVSTIEDAIKGTEKFLNELKEKRNELI